MRPWDERAARVPLYSEDFAADPHAAYEAMRSRYGSLVPVWLAPGVPATLVIGWHTAVRILHDDGRFPADPVRWASTAGPSAVYEVMAPRDNALRTSGPRHLRLRAAITAAVDAVDLFEVEQAVDRAAEDLINDFCTTGRADLLAAYAFPLTFRVMCDLLGLAPGQARQAWAEMADMLDGVAEAGPRFADVLYSVVQAKRAEPGVDMMSRLITHGEALTDAEVVAQTMLLLGPGTEPTSNLIGNTILLVLTDDRIAGGVHGGALETRDAIDAVLFDDTPLANFCMSYPRQPQLVDGCWLPADQPVVISMAACNADPANDRAGVDRRGNRSHLSWGAGVHACPAQPVARLISQRAVDQLLDALPDIQLAPGHEPTHRPGPFHRALSALHVTFPVCAPMNLAMPPLRRKEPR
ncbi:cytochrome P450 [Nocardia nova]|uniref:cytochrome P450 n=1 Tax=Nocardia nova TaxID=37330 RepID=UPI00340A2815